MAPPVVIAAPGWTEELGGAIQWIREVAVRLAARGWSVHALATTAADGRAYWDPRAHRVEPGRTDDAGVDVRLFPPVYLTGAHWRVARALALAPWLAPRLSPPSPWSPALERAAREWSPRPAVVHGTCFPMDGPVWAARGLALRAGCPFAITPLLHFGRGAEDRAWFLRYYGRPHQRRMLREADLVFVLGEREGTEAVALGARDDAVRVVGAGVDPDRLAGGDAARFRASHAIPPDLPVVLHLANRSEEKGSLTVLEAWELLHAGQEQRALLVVAGGATEAVDARTRALAERAPILDLGRVDEATKRDALAASSLFVLPSRVETFGIVFLEAWACGVPVIGARAGGIPDVIDDGGDGLLVPFGDAAQLAEAMAGALGDPEWRATAAARGGAKTLARFTWQHVADAVHAAYVSVGASPGP